MPDPDPRAAPAGAISPEQEADQVRRARLIRDVGLSPAERLRKLACADVDALRELAS